MKSVLFVSLFIGCLAVGCMKPPDAASAASSTAKVERRDLESKVIETGTVDAVQAVEVKSRVSGRLKRLFVEEGDFVKAGQLIAEIDPAETELQLKQNEAQLRGAQSSVARASVEMDQRRQTAAADYRQAQLRVQQLEAEAKAQPTLTDAAIRVSKATLESAKREIERLNTTSQPNARSADVLALNQAKANLATTSSEYERQKNLFEQGYVAKRVVETANLNLEVARLQLAQAQDNHDRLEGQLQNEMAKAEESVRQAQADYDRTVANRFQNQSKRQDYENAVAGLAKARAALKDVQALEAGRRSSQATVDQLSSVVADSRRNLGETEIRAPMDGVVTKKEALEGDLVTGLSSFSVGTPIVRLEDRKSLRILLNVNEIDTAKLREGMGANIDVEAVPGVKFAGTVHRIAPASNSTGSATATADAVVRYQVEVWLAATDPRLRSGMSARCTIVTASRKGVLSLPIDFLTKEGSGYVALVPSGAEKSKTKAEPTKVKVTTGLDTGAFIEILSGLSDGQTVTRPAFSGPARQGFMDGGPSDE